MEVTLYRKFADAAHNFNRYNQKKEMTILQKHLSGKSADEGDEEACYEDIQYIRLNERYKGTFIPTFDQETDMWVVDTEHGIEYGDIAYVAAEFCGDNTTYPFYRSDMEGQQQKDHEHTFEAVLGILIDNTDGFSVENDKGCYSDQELRVLDNLKKALITVRGRNYPLTREEISTGQVQQMA
jgi:hypothetical protein